MSEHLKSKTVFLQRSSYRQRRLRDAARMMPVLGLVLWMLPLSWQSEAEGGNAGSSAALYIFGVWVLLIVATGVLARRVRTEAAQSPAGKSAP